MTSDVCPVCGGKKFWRSYTTPVNGKMVTTTLSGCQNCHTATVIE
jgi:C4-type Zn-finger protein